jgi:hypothetical protein
VPTDNPFLAVQKNRSRHWATGGLLSVCWMYTDWRTVQSGYWHNNNLAEAAAEQETGPSREWGSNVYFGHEWTSARRSSPLTIMNRNTPHWPRCFAPKRVGHGSHTFLPGSISNFIDVWISEIMHGNLCTDCKRSDIWRSINCVLAVEA